MSIALQNLSIEISGTQICQGLDLEFSTGQVWCVLGCNGVGKTTLLKTLAGLRPPNSGNVRLNGRPVQRIARRQRAQQLSILFQDSETLFPTTVLETVLTGRHPWISPLRGEGAHDRDKAMAALERVGMAHLAERSMSSLSGGERRRVDLAAVFVQESECVLLDEPGNHLDMHHQVAVLGGMVQQWKSQGGLVILVMHDVNLALRFSDHLLLLFGDGEVEHGPAQAIATETTLTRLYRHRMMSLDTPQGRWYLPA
ncbi:MAG TPA: ABC transporter ATP-binding protein [Gammaproteobacteria bacterium]|nr:ABC transporter ATP-binding protein [Gammaproteobacteria bacterium]